MNKVLIISSSFPPNSSVGGVRPAYFFKYFNEENLDTHVLTVKQYNHNNLMDIPFDNALSPKIHQIEYSQEQEKIYLVNRSFSQKVRDFFNPTYSSPPGLLDEVIRKIDSFIDIKSFDLIIATVPDMWTASLASLLFEKHKVKYLIDFRDAYEQEIGMPRSLRQKVQVARLKRERKKITKNAFELITVSKYLANKLQANLNKKTSVIYNGFDENLFNSNSIKENSPTKIIKIVYTGRILNVWYRNPYPLIEGIEHYNKINEGNKKIELHFYGTEKELLKRKDLINGVTFHDRVPHEEVNKIINEADLLLVLTNNERRGILTTKLFEYMPINRPILCLPNDDDELKQIIEENGLGFSLKNKDEIIEFFENLDKNLDSFKTNNGLRKNVDLYTRKNQSLILADYIKKL